jgi:hypothetical protein
VEWLVAVAVAVLGSGGFTLLFRQVRREKDAKAASDEAAAITSLANTAITATHELISARRAWAVAEEQVRQERLARVRCEEELSGLKGRAG